MFYTYTITVPAATAQNAPAELDLSLSHGVIHRVSVSFPPGCAHLVEVTILQHNHQLWPSSVGGTLKADSFTIEWDDYFELFEPPHVLIARCWAPTTRFPHDIEIRIGLLPARVAEHQFGRSTRQGTQELRNAFGLPPLEK